MTASGADDTLTERTAYLEMTRNVSFNICREDRYRLLAIKDSDIRLDVLFQGVTAKDRALHIGGAFSSVIPMVALYYAGYINMPDRVDLTSKWNDIYVLSKGHGIATMAAVFADMGYMDRSLLKGSRALSSQLNAHPGPILPGVHVSTGPLGQGLSTAVGFALSKRIEENGNVFCMVGDGEMQEGNIWEAFMYAGAERLENLCVIVDNNNGQGDTLDKLLLPGNNFARQIESFGFHVIEVNGSSYREICDALEEFTAKKHHKPVAIISKCKKGEGGFGSTTLNHKIKIEEEFGLVETQLQEERRKTRVGNVCEYVNRLAQDSSEMVDAFVQLARNMNLEICFDGSGCAVDVRRILLARTSKRAPVRDKAIRYNAAMLPTFKQGEWYECQRVVADAIYVFARDRRMVSVDSDSGAVSGLYPGMRRVDQQRAVNVGIAEANMAGVAEGFAAYGYNAWCGTFTLFYEWRVLRRIAVSYQERQEAIALEDGWLSEGHNLDITFIGASSNIDTQTNGATHMSTDDICVLSQIPHLKVIEVSCPRQLLSVLQWIVAGNKGLILLRIMRSKVQAIYDESFTFAYNKAYVHGDLDAAKAVLISSGRGVHEALCAASILNAQNIPAVAVDMPSIDAEMFKTLSASGKLLVFYEQNNGYLLGEFFRAAYDMGYDVCMNNLISINTLDENREKQFIHSGTYEEIIEAQGLRPEDIVCKVAERLGHTTA